MRKKVLLLILLAALLLPVGCGTAPSALSRPAQSVTALTCLRPDSVPTLVSLGSGQVLACHTDHEAHITYLDIIDVLRDTVTASTQFEGDYELSAQRPDGAIALRNREMLTYTLLDTSLHEKDTLSVPTVDGFFSHDGSGYFFVAEQALYRLNTADGTADIAVAGSVHFTSLIGIHPTQDCFAAMVYTSPFSLEIGTAVVDADTGEVRLLQAGLWDVSQGEDAMTLIAYDSDRAAPFAVYSTADAPETFYRFAAPAAGSEAVWSALRGSDLLLSTDGEATVLYRLGAAVGACDLSQCGLSGELYSAAYLDDTQLILGGVYGNGVFTLYLLDPIALPFTDVGAAQAASFVPVDETVAAAYDAALERAPLPAYLDSLRAQADELETRCGVRILLSSQCEALRSYTDQTFTTTAQWDEATELARIARALDGLDAALCLYPADFFTQCRTSYGDGGLCFLLTASVGDDGLTVGSTSEIGSWNCIALDISLSQLTGITCHEIWHATENTLLARAHTLIDETAWSAWNPADFAYYMTYPGQSDSGKWTLFGAAGEGVYFIDDYARTNAREDRARLMEYVMQDDTTLQRIMDSPALHEKLQIMCQAIRKGFDTTTWDNVRWERGF